MRRVIFQMRKQLLYHFVSIVYVVIVKDHVRYLGDVFLKNRYLNNALVLIQLEVLK